MLKFTQFIVCQRQSAKLLYFLKISTSKVTFINSSFLFINFFIFVYIKGKFIIMKSTPNFIPECMNLPDEWLNKTSSLLTNGCVVVYSGKECTTDKKPELFSKIKLNFADKYFSQPSKIPNKNFVGTW